MTIRHIRIFLTVCDCGCNLTKAAEQLYTAQPAVTVAIHELERYYGVNLFDRLGRRLYLTEAGEQYREYAQRILALYDDMERGIKNWDALGVLRIGSSITIGSQFMPSYVEAFSKRYPGIDVRVAIGTSEMMEKKLLDNAIDLALVESPVHHEYLEAKPYLEDFLTVIAPAREPFGPGQVLTPEEFKRQRLLLREKGSGTREVFDEVMERLNLYVEPVWEAMSTTALVNGVIHGLGISVVPRRMVSAPLERGMIYSIRVEGAEFKRWFYMVHHRDKMLTKSIKDFMELCSCFELDYPVPKYSGLF